MPTSTSPNLRQSLIRQKINMKGYLAELTALLGRPVHADELSSLEQTAKMRAAAQHVRPQQITQACEILFSERCSERFKKFVNNLKMANPSPVYIWMKHSIDCGTLLVQSIELIDFEFDFSIGGGVISFLTGDMRDGLLLDFSLSLENEKIMRIENHGVNWGGVTY